MKSLIAIIGIAASAALGQTTPQPGSGANPSDFRGQIVQPPVQVSTDDWDGVAPQGGGVLWDQSNVDPDINALVDQVFPDFPDFDAYLVTDVVVGASGWTIDSVTTYFTAANGAWPGSADGTLNIFEKTGALPGAGDDPGAGMTVPVTITDIGGVLAVEASGLGINLSAGEYWIGLNPNLSFGDFGQEFHLAAPIVGGDTAFRNPGGAFNVGTEWQDCGAIDTSGVWVGNYDASILITGEEGGGGNDCGLKKSPDQGAFWQPLSPDGSYVYANSFVPCDDGEVSELGTWLLDLSGTGGPDVRFEVWGSIGGNPANGPDAGNVLAGTGSLSLPGTATLDFYSAETTFTSNLSAGTTYWFVATCVGEGGEGSWQVGGHTQNSEGINDNGTFWFSNDPSGVDFDGQGFTPEMAFCVEQGGGGPVKGTLFFSEDSNVEGLYTINTSTGAVTHVGLSGTSAANNGIAPSGDPAILWGSEPFGVQQIMTDGSGWVDIGPETVEGMAYDPMNDTLYGSINGNFFTINQATGTLETSLPAPPNGEDVEGLAWAASGLAGGGPVVYGIADGTGNIHVYDIGSNSWSTVGATGISFQSSSLAYNPGENVLYAKGSQDSDIYMVNPANAATSVIGDTGIAAGGGLAFIGGGGCYPDCNGDGDLNILDFVCFQEMFQAGADYADCNGDGDLNILDFVCFQEVFQAGCP